MVKLLDPASLELPVQGAVRLGAARQEQGAAGLLIQAVDDPERPVARLQQALNVRRPGFPALREGGQPGGLVETEQGFIQV
jgi:hypothetical protein